jgi:UDP-2,3-diacylglucosamine pyrophosphatase LpxH
MVYQKKNGSVETYYQHTSEEQAVKDKKAFIVYGHTHHSEVVSLDNVNSKDQIYINSGTWRAVYEMAKADYKLPRFVNYKVMTYLAFFKDDERGGRKFESWSGSLG